MCIIAGQSFAQNTKRAFKLLEKAEFDKAYVLFKEAYSENKESPAALLGLTLLTADDSSSYFNLIDSWKYACSLNVNIEKLSTEELEFIGEYFYNTEKRHISRPVKKKIEYAIETVEAKLIKYVREENNLEIVYQVLKDFPDFKYYENVTHIRNQLEFRKYEKLNTLDGYLEFMKKFPDAAQIEKAIKNRNKLAFENADKLNTVESYKAFIKMYPDATEVNTATKRLNAVAFEKAKQLNTIQAFDNYMAEFPDALETSEARLIQKQLLYEYAKKIQTLKAYNEFIRKYPDGQQYIDIFNLKSLDNGMRYIRQFSLSENNTLWARSYEEEENEELTACMTVDTLNSYIIGGTVFRTDTGSTDAWVIKISADGKMLWNKYVGEEFNDELTMLGINNRNEILGTGYTWMGRDTSSRESWLFKMGQEGQKIWSRKLGKMHINCMTLSKTGSVILGGYVVNDSLQHLYSVVILNENGKRLWGRTYTGKGEIIQIAESSDQKLLLTGNHWRAKIDPKGYLLWETGFNVTDSIVASQIMSKGEICYLGYRNSNKMVLIKTSGDNKLLLEKELTLPEIQSTVQSVEKGGPNQLIMLVKFEDHQSINWINTMSGEISASMRVEDGAGLTGLAIDRKNNLLIQAFNGEIVVIKNNGTVF
jgi:hypothetical protein